MNNRSFASMCRFSSLLANVNIIQSKEHLFVLYMEIYCGFVYMKEDSQNIQEEKKGFVAFI